MASAVRRQFIGSGGVPINKRRRWRQQIVGGGETGAGLYIRQHEHLYFRTNNSSITPFFSQFVLCQASNNTTSRNIGGWMHAWAVPHLKFWGDRPPSIH